MYGNHDYYNFVDLTFLLNTAGFCTLMKTEDYKKKFEKNKSLSFIKSVKN